MITDVAQHGPRAVRRSLLVWAVRAVALIALIVAGYLLYSSGMKRSAPLGCAPGSGCDLVLASRWAKLFGLPVTLGAVVVYVSLLAASLYASPGAKPHQQRNAWTVLLLLAIVILASAIWFTVLQLAVLHSICPWCMVEHALGTLVAIMIFLGAPLRGSAGQVRITLPRLGLMTAIGLLLVGGMIVGQILTPVTYAIRTQSGQFTFDLRRVPLYGSPDAPHVIGIMTDYTCPVCRMMHRNLDRLRERYGRQIAIAMLPVPLSEDCNPSIEPGATPRRHREACELAKIALAVWLADPQAFVQMEKWLFEPAEPRSADEARQHAINLVGAEAFAQASGDPQVQDMIGQNVNLYIDLGNAALPKLLVNNIYLDGLPADLGLLYRALERNTSLVPLTEPSPATAPTTQPH